MPQTVFATRTSSPARSHWNMSFLVASKPKPRVAAHLNTRPSQHRPQWKGDHVRQGTVCSKCGQHSPASPALTSPIDRYRFVVSTMIGARSASGRNRKVAGFFHRFESLLFTIELRQWIDRDLGCVRALWTLYSRACHAGRLVANRQCDRLRTERQHGSRAARRL